MSTPSNVNDDNNQKKSGDISDDLTAKQDASQSTDSDITPAELELLDKAGANEPSDQDDDTALNESLLDNTDEEGDELNEQIDLTGEDLDVPGSEKDDDDESIGEEDEENNNYSLSDQEDDTDPVL